LRCVFVPKGQSWKNVNGAENREGEARIILAIAHESCDMIKQAFT